MEKCEIRQRFERALHNFYSKEALLIKYKVCERALTHKLAEHLQKQFPHHHVDCEYNRVGRDGDPKRLSVLMLGDPDCPCNCAECHPGKCVIFPDIIVHRRGTGKNLLVIEAKTAWGGLSPNHDHQKLVKLTASGLYHYRLGIAFCFTSTCANTLKTIKEYSEEYEK